MALAPKFAGQKLVSKNAVHTLEIYLDYTCPFSAKLFNTIYNTSVRTALESKSNSLETILRPLIQPWHPSSTLCHESALAVQRLDSSKFWTYSDRLFTHQKEYFDVSVVNETRNETYKRLAKLAKEVGVDEGKVYGLLEISDKPGEDGSLNIGNEITNDLKLQVRAARLVGIHVTPTVVFDGIVNADVSSSWSEGQWKEWLDKNVG